MEQHQYGIDINTLEKFLTHPAPEREEWGERALLIAEPAFRLERLHVLAAKTAAQGGDDNFEATLFVEAGRAEINGVATGSQETIALPPRQNWEINARENTLIYAFLGLASSQSDYGGKSKPFDYRDKYWGNIQTIVSKDYAGKRIFVKKGEHASLEYHCRKTEAYFIHSGKLLLRLRAGRGEDRFFTLGEGAVSFTPPGLMHQRGGFEDTVIIEISTRDEDSDSFLVEDGQKIRMPTLPG